MTRDPQVDLIFLHFIPRYEATGVDPSDLRALMPRIAQWSDWCALWSAEAARHETLAGEALAAGFRLTRWLSRGCLTRWLRRNVAAPHYRRDCRRPPVHPNHPRNRY